MERTAGHEFFTANLRGKQIRAEIFQAAVAGEKGNSGAAFAIAEQLEGSREMGAGGKSGEEAFLGGNGFVIGDLEIARNEGTVEQG